MELTDTRRHDLAGPAAAGTAGPAVAASGQEVPTARHRGSPETDVLTELHRRHVGRHRRPGKPAEHPG